MKELFALFRHTLAGLRVLVAGTVVLGLAYPLLITGIGQVVMPWHADGSLVSATGAHTSDTSTAVGSAIIGQNTEAKGGGAGLFFPRPSSAGDKGYDMLDTYGSNLGPRDPALVKAVKQRRAEVSAREGVAPDQVPADALMGSGSGLDPDISPAYAAIQVPRVAKANGLSEATVRKLVEENTHGATLGVMGDDHVNVLLLNMAVKKAH